MRNYILLAASLLFYGYGEPRFVFVMLGSVLLNYLLALLIGIWKERSGLKYALLFLAVFANIGLLFVYKYLNFTASNLNRLFGTSFHTEIALPIGISFFTFQAMSYVIDVYRGSVAVQKNPLYLALYISFFPQLIAGPIVRYHTIEQQITDRTCSLELFGDGARRFLLGFSKKVILANNLSVVSEEIFALAEVSGPLSCAQLWLGAICYSLQIYYDFSGYSDMAIGLGKLFGFTFEENFRYPYICDTVTDFWRRWHISLGSWFRDYVYIPLGGSRVGRARHILNLFLVWLLTGIWHGANWTFLFWGLWYFLLLVLEKFLVVPQKRPILVRIIWRCCSLLAVLLGWVMFNASSVSVGLRYWRGLFGFYSVSADAALSPVSLAFQLREYGLFIAAGLLFATPAAKVLSGWLDRGKLTALCRAVIAPLCLGAVFLWAVSFLVLGVHNPFIYFNF